MEFFWFILIGLAAGWVAGQLTKGGSFGVVGDILVGVIGALLGGFLLRTLAVPASILRKRTLESKFPSMSECTPCDYV